MAFNDLQGQDWPFSLRGRIDRLDYHPEDADLVVWDYKSGEIPKKGKVLDDLEESQLPCYLLAVQQGRVPVNQPAANLRAGFIGLKSPRSHHLKHEDFGVPPSKWQEAAAAFAAKVTALGRRLAAGDFRPDPTPAPEGKKLGACQYCPYALGLRLCPGAGRGRGRGVGATRRVAPTRTAMTHKPTPPADQAIRDQALGPLEGFHLEAPAGSGKTSVLLARFLTLLARVDTPEEMLALTFTRKAAGELRARVMALLWERQDPGPDASPLELRLRELAAAVFRRHGDEAQLKLTPERLPIMTFHGFGAQLLKLAPQEAGVPLAFTLLEEDEARWLKAEALDEMRRRLNRRSPRDPVRQALIRRLVRLNNDWGRLAQELSGLLSRRDSLGDFLDLARVSRDAAAYRQLLEERFRMVLQPSLEELRASLAGCALGKVWPGFWRELQGSAHGNLILPELPGSAPADLPAWQALSEILLTKQGDPRKRLSPKDGFPEGFDQKKWSPLIQDLPGPVVRILKQCRDLTPTGASPEEAAALQDLVILVGEALSVYEQLCARKGALDFVDLEAATLNLLTEDDPTEVMLRLDWRLKHLLVDEFQDTSVNQMQLLCRLMAGWQAGAGRTLMVVGDPKQSIYGWRQAKPRLFMASRNGLPCGGSEPLPLTPLTLTTNFRATRTLITWANEVFGATVMKGGAAGADVPSGRVPPRGRRRDPPRLWRCLAGDSDLAARELEARWLARQVAQARASLGKDETIGILLFTRKHLSRYLQALYDAGLAVRVREGLKLAESRTVAHLHNLARALTRPQDEVAWAAALRGPWGPQPLATLARVAQMPGDLWPEKLRRFTAPTEPDDCTAALPGLAESLQLARCQVGRRPLSDILTGFLEETSAWAGIAAWEGPRGVANARTYLDLLAAADDGLPEATFVKADFNLQAAFQPPDPQAQASPVEILTVHGAKGLEFHQVFLPFLDWQPLKSEDNTPPFLLEEIPGRDLHGLALARPYIQEKQSSLYLLLRDVKNQRVVDEARRVFYVAVTRARQRLVMSGLARLDKQGNWQCSGDSPLAWLKEHYRLDLPPAGSAVSWPEPEMDVELITEVQSLTGETAPPGNCPRPGIFPRKPRPFR